MDSDENKKILMKFHEALNRKDWATSEALIHDDVDDSLIEGWKSSRIGVVNPWGQFLIALGFSEEALVEFISINRPDTGGKTASIKLWKWVRQFMSDFEIYSMVAEGEKVIGKSYCVLNLPSGDKISMDTYIEFLIRDSKIIAFAGTNRLFNSLQQFGKITIERSDKKEIERYIHSLKQMGLLPANH